MIDEPESEALALYLETARPRLVTSRIALVEVVRAATVAHPSLEVRMEAERRVRSCTLVDIGDRFFRRASALASATIRTVDAIHLATAELASAELLLAYDRHLAEAAESLGIATLAPS